MSMNAKNFKYLTGPFSANNPVIVQILGICSALAVTVQLKPAIVMALSVTVVTAFANLVMSLLRNGVPSRSASSFSWSSSPHWSFWSTKC